MSAAWRNGSWHAVWAVGLLVGSGTLAAGCTQEVASPSLTQPQFCPAMPCFCPEGREGACVRGGPTCACTSACNCNACPDYAIDTPVPFVACGGDPAGAWRAQRLVVGDFSIGSATFAGDGCLAAPRSTPDFSFTLTAPNQMSVSLQAYVSVPALTSCFGVDECDDIFVINSGSCAPPLDFDSSTSCGVCSCSFEFNDVSGNGTFGVTGTTLSLSLSGAGCSAGTINCTVQFDYCVRADGVLDLRDADGFRFEMARM